MGYEQMEPLKKVEEAVKIVKILLTGETTSGGARLDFRPEGTGAGLRGGAGEEDAGAGRQDR
jgi:hypothetical protein